MGAVQREITGYVYQNCWWLIIEMGHIFSISKFSDLLLIDYNVLNLQINQISVLISQFDLLSLSVNYIDGLEFSHIIQFRF